MCMKPQRYTGVGSAWPTRDVYTSLEGGHAVSNKRPSVLG